MSYTSPFDLGPNPGQPWVVYYSDSLALVTGGGNGNMNNGDSLFLTLRLKNLGDQPASDVTAVVTTSSPFVMITDSTAVYGLLEAGGEKSDPNGLTLDVSDTIPDNLRVRFDVRVTDPDTVWYSHFSIEAHAPALAINSLAVVDTLAGNGNGRMEPGETVQLVVPVANTGDFSCPGTYALLACPSPFLTLVTDSVPLGTIVPKLVKTGVFTVTVSPGTPAGSGIDLWATARSGALLAHRTFRQVIGLVAEDWESHTFTRFPWQQGGTMPWALTGSIPYEGEYAAASGVIGDYQNSQLFITYTSVADDSISFYLRTSTEQDYDFLMFAIDGVLQGQWSGETPWTRASFPVAAGEHTFKWLYVKDLALAGGQDRVWLDFIAFPAPLLPVVEPGPADTVCAGSPAPVQALVQFADSLSWSTSGDGIFANDTLAVTTYLPGPGDQLAGEAILLLTAYGTYGNTSRTMSLTILPRFEAGIHSILPNDTVCLGQTISLKADTAGIRSWNWSPGNFSGPAAAYDTLTAGGTGTRRIILSVLGDRCGNSDTVYLTFRDCTGTGEADTESEIIRPNPGNGIVLIDVTTRNPGTLQIEVRNSVNRIVYGETDLNERKCHRKRIDLTFLPDGVYLLSLTTVRGTSAHKVIIRK